MDDMNKSATLRKEGLKFSYNFNKHMKIDINRLKKKREEAKDAITEEKGI